MTDEDLRKTVADIRQASHDVDMVKSMLETAADEIERLAEKNRRLQITPLGIEAAAHAIKLVANNGIGLEECRLLARASLVAAFP